MFILIAVGVILFVAIGCGALTHGRGLFASGEEYVSRLLGDLPPEKYVVLNDVMLPTKDGITTQVDHVVVGTTGIFVVETKNYSGWIFGSEKQREWTQCLENWRCRSVKHHFQNPIRQNWRHIYTMADLLQLPLRYFKNVVVFVGSARFKTDMPDYVMRGGRVSSYVSSFSVPVMSDAMVSKVATSIRAWEAQVTVEQRRAHVSNLKAHHDPTCLSVMCSQGTLKCPKCGAKMVLRHRRSDNAPFYGCSNYPACRGIVNASR